MNDIHVLKTTCKDTTFFILYRTGYFREPLGIFSEYEMDNIVDEYLKETDVKKKD